MGVVGVLGWGEIGLDGFAFGGGRVDSGTLDLEKEGLVFAEFNVEFGVDAVTDDSVTPGTGSPTVAYVDDGEPDEGDETDGKVVY